MKNHFNLRRFGLLFRKHTSEHFKTYLMALGVLVGALFIVIGWASYINREPLSLNLQSTLFTFFLIGSGTVFTSTVFSNLSDKKRAIATLMMPASQFEKFLVGWIYSFVLFLLVFTGAFYLVDSMVLSLQAEPGELINIFKYNNLALAMVGIYALLHGVAIWGAIAFEKLSFIKTAFSFFIFVLLLTLLNNAALEWMLGRDLNSSVPFSQVVFQEQKEFFFLQLRTGWVKNMEKVFPICLAFILWLAAFMRLKEKEI